MMMKGDFVDVKKFQILKEIDFMTIFVCFVYMLMNTYEIHTTILRLLEDDTTPPALPA